jgi:hypothetical protein
MASMAGIIKRLWLVLSLSLGRLLYHAGAFLQLPAAGLAHPVRGFPASHCGGGDGADGALCGSGELASAAGVGDSVFTNGPRPTDRLWAPCTGWEFSLGA